MTKHVPTRYEMQKIYFSHTKLPWKYPAIVLFLTIVDIILLIFFFLAILDAIPLSGIITLHLGIGIILYILRRFSSPQTRNISPMLFVMLPGIGALIYGISYLSLYLTGARQARKEIKHLYNQEVEIKYDKHITIDFNNIAKLMDMSGVFHFSSSINKKHMIIDLLSLETIETYRILKEGLWDKESEVVHYTASALNYLEEQYEKAIQKARDSVAEELTLENFESLLRLYENYIASGLLEDDFLPVYQKKIIDVLELQIAQLGPELHAVKHLTKAYLAQGEKKKAYEMIQKVFSNHHLDLELQILIMNYFYNIDEFDQIVHRAKQIVTDYSEILSEEQKNIVLFWANQEAAL